MSEAENRLPAAMDAPKDHANQPDELFYVVENQTARSIQIAPTEATSEIAPLIIPPFGTRRIAKTQYDRFDFRRWEDPGLIVSTPEPKPEGRKHVTAAEVTVYGVVAAILVWAVSVLPDSPYQQSPVLLIMAFCIGVVPETGIKVIQEFMRKTVGRFSASLDERDPLTRLEGIDLYDRARLSEEGVDNVENLAYHNLIDLLVKTRIPARRLADMVDQAILYLHLRDVPLVLSAEPAATQSADQRSTDSTADDPSPALKYLRGYGIRTATDLMQAWRTEAQSGSRNFKTILRDQPGDFADRINVLVNALEDADWMPQLQYRRAQVSELHEKPVEDPHDFFEKEKTGVGWRDSAGTADGNRQAASERVDTGSHQVVASTPVITASGPVPTVVETLEPHS